MFKVQFFSPSIFWLSVYIARRLIYPRQEPGTVVYIYKCSSTCRESPLFWVLLKTWNKHFPKGTVSWDFLVLVFLYHITTHGTIRGTLRWFLPNIHGGIQKNVQQCINRSCTVHIRQNKLRPVGGVSFTAEWRLPDVRFYTAQSLFSSVRYTANWRQVYFALYVLCNSQNKLGASWRCILHRRTVTPRCKILHWEFWELHSTYKAK